MFSFTLYRKTELKAESRSNYTHNLGKKHSSATVDRLRRFSQFNQKRRRKAKVRKPKKLRANAKVVGKKGIGFVSVPKLNARSAKRLDIPR